MDWSTLRRLVPRSRALLFAGALVLLVLLLGGYLLCVLLALDAESGN